MIKSEQDHTCEFCYYEFFDDKAYPCSRCVCNQPTENLWRPKIKTESQTEALQDWKDRMWAEAIVTEPQTGCNGCKFVGTYDTEFPCANCSRKTKDYYAKTEPQERSE